MMVPSGFPARALAALGLVLASVLVPTAAPATVDDGDASCACPTPGPYVAPAGTEDPFIGDDGSSAQTAPRYRVSVSGAPPATTVEVRRVSDSSLVLSLTTALTHWGFSPDQDRFVVTGLVNGLHEVRLHDLTSATPASPVVQVSTTEHGARLGFSPHGEYFAYTGLLDGTSNTVRTQVWDSRTGTRRHDTTYVFDVGASQGDELGEAGFGFSPDDDEFFYAYRSGQQTVQWSLVDLDAGVQRSSGTMTGTGFWQFSPCGEVLALVEQNSQASMEVTLRSTDTGAVVSSTSYPVADIDFVRTATHHRAVVDGVAHDLVAVSPPVPDVCAPRWPDQAALQAEASGPGQVTLTWSAATDDTEVTAYRVYRGATLVGSTAATPRELVVSGLSAETTYTFRVEAGDAAGNWSDDGPSVEVTTAGAGPSWPAGASLLASDVSSTGLRLTWSSAVDDQGVTGYRVFRDGEVVATLAAAPRTYVVSGLTRATSYTFRVEALDADDRESTGGPSVTVATDSREPLDRNAVLGTVFIDANRNGIQDSGEPGVQSPTVWSDYLDVFAFRVDAAGRVLDRRTTQTGADGSYSFEGLAPGTWMVGQGNYDVFYGMRQQTRPAELQPHVVEVGPQSGWSGVDFGLDAARSWPSEYPDGPASIRGVVFEDLDRDGVQDAGEDGMPGISPTCYRMSTAGGPGCGNDLGLSGADGSFERTGLGIGVYTVHPPVVDGYWRTTREDYVVAATAGSTTGSVAFGLLEGRSSIVGQVFADADGDGVKDPGEGGLGDGVWLNLCVQGPLADGCVNPAADGSYTLGGLVDDDYVVQVSLGGDPNLRITTPAAQGQTVTIAVNGQSVSALPIGVRDLRASVSGVTFADEDGDGAQDAGEPGLGGADVCLTDTAPGTEDGTCMRTAFDDPSTDADETGRYRFDRVRPGTYDLTSQSFDYPPTLPAGGEARLTVPESGAVRQDLGFAPPAGAPSVPRDVTAAPGPSSAVVSWLPADAGSAGSVTGYVLRWSRRPDSGSWTMSGLAQGPTYTITDLDEGEPHWVQVRALNSAGGGWWSERIRVVPGEGTATPTPTPTPTPTSTPTPTPTPTSSPTATPTVAPTSAPATTPPVVPPPVVAPPTPSSPSAPRSLEAVAGKKGITLTWKPPRGTSDARITDYVVRLATKRSGPWRTVKDQRGTRTSYLLPRRRLAGGTTYWFRIAAKSSAGLGAWSSRVKVRWR